MDLIIEKARKILALAEKGVDGEMQSAKLSLERLLKKHNLTIEDLTDTKRTERSFPYSSKDETSLIYHCMLKVFGRNSPIYKGCYRYRGRRDNQVYAEMTDVEYIDFDLFYKAYRSQYKKDKKELLDNLLSAFVNKHNLFDPDDEAAEPTSNIDWAKLERLWAMQKGMGEVNIHKQIE